MESLAKPSGISLRDHRQHVFDQAKRLLETWPNLIQKYKRLTGGDLKHDLLTAAWWHDVGKEHDQWQSACRKDYKAYQTWLIEQGKPIDLLDPAVYNAYERYMRQSQKVAGKHIMKCGLRHELASLEIIHDKGKEFPLSVLAAIGSHHGKLSRYHERRWKQDAAKADEEGPFYEFFKKFKWEANAVQRKGWEKSVLERYKYSGVRALLQLADTRASRAEAGENLAPLGKFEVVEHFPTHKPVQEAALTLGDEMISILRAPTGSGKTYASLLWAEKHIKEGSADRLVVAMPTRFTSNALAIGLEANVSETGLYHSSAWFNRYGDTRGQERSDATELHKMAQRLATPINVCTIDHLMICLTGAKEIHHSTFFFLANSAVVFDEADFYDPFVQANLTVLLKTLRLLQVPVLIMSATVPNSALALYDIPVPIKSPPEEKRAKSYKERKLKWVGEADAPEDVAETLAFMAEKGQGIIYANTIASALSYYRWFYENHPSVTLILYHSRFKEGDKAQIEDRLLTALGKKAWEEKAASGVAILTQIGEMSVNISSNIMLTEVCPWDRLAQRIGRLSRFGKGDEGGIAYIVAPKKNDVVYPAPYGEFDLMGREWKPSEAFKTTLEDLSKWPSEGLDSEITPAELVRKVNRLYPTQPEFAPKDQANRAELERLMKNNWLIVPNQKSEEGSETQVGEKWRSRHIPPQSMVIANEAPPTVFERYDDYYGFILKHGVTVPEYLIQKELRKGKDNSHIGVLSDRKVGDEEVFFYYTSSYCEDTGLSFLYDPWFSKPNNQL